MTNQKTLKTQFGCGVYVIMYAFLLCFSSGMVRDCFTLSFVECVMIVVIVGYVSNCPTLLFILLF